MVNHWERPRAALKQEVMLPSSRNQQLIRTLASPQYWLVFGRDWPAGAAGGAAECAVATTPQFAPRSRFSPDAQRVLDVVAAFVARRPQQQLVMFGEISGSLAEANTSWPGMGIDWEAVLDELTEAPIPSLFLTLDQWSHYLLSTVGIPHTTAYFSDGTQRVIERHEYEALRTRLTTLLVQDWPAYIAKIQSKIIGS